VIIHPGVFFARRRREGAGAWAVDPRLEMPGDQVKSLRLSERRG